MEGTGKSTLAQQVGLFLDHNMTINNIIFSPKQFEEAVNTLPKYSVIVWDEAITGTQATDMTKMARTLQRVAVQMRQKNLYIILVLHSYYEMKKYYAIHRTWFLLHTYYRPNLKRQKFERGYFSFFDRDTKRTMYCNDKLRRNYDYGYKPQFRGRFTKKYGVNEQEYKSKKARIDDIENIEERLVSLKDAQLLAMQRNPERFTPIMFAKVFNCDTSQVFKYRKQWEEGEGV